MNRKIAAVVMTDSHLSESTVELNKTIFKQVVDFCVDNQIYTIIHCGDIFHSRKSQSQVVLTTFEEILDIIHEAGLKMICVVGNHDKTDYKSKKSFLSPYKYHPSFTLFDEYHTLSLHGGLDAHFLAYFDEEIYVEYLEKNVKLVGSNSILFTHIDVNGARMNNGTPIENNIKPALFKKFKSVKVGHYHDKQSFANIDYFGAAIQHNFGEKEEKGIHVLYDDGEMEMVPLDFPKYRKYEVDVKTLTQKDLDDLREEKEVSEDYLQVILVGEEKDVKAYNIQSLKEIGIDVRLKVPEIEISELETRIEPFNPETLVEQFKVFCDKNELDYEQGLTYFKTVQYV